MTEKSLLEKVSVRVTTERCVYIGKSRKYAHTVQRAPAQYFPCGLIKIRYDRLESINHFPRFVKPFL